MSITMNLNDLFVFILIICAVVLIIYSIITLSRFNKTLKGINEMLDSNKKNIDSSIKTFPEICDNVNDITKSVKEKTNLLDDYFVKNDETAASLDLESIVSSIQSVINLFSHVKGHFEGRKKSRFRK